MCVWQGEGKFSLEFNKQVCVWHPINWVSHNSTQFWHHLLRDSIRFCKLRAQNCNSALSFRGQLQARLSLALLTNWLLSLPPSSLGSINFLEWLTELREHICSPDCQLLWKDITQEQSDERDTQGRIWRRGTEIPCPLPAQLSWISMCSTVKNLPSSHPFEFIFIFIEASLQRHDWLNRWPLGIDSTFSPLSSPEVRSETKSSNPLIHRWFSLQPAPSQKSPH